MTLNMKKITMKKPLLFLAAPLVLSAASGCMSMQNQQVQDAVQSGTKPYVEAYIEYIGPGARWLGPATWIVHVNTRELNHPEVSVTPDFAGAPSEPPAAKLAEAPKPAKPAAAAVSGAAAPTAVAAAHPAEQRSTASATGLSGPALREQIAALAVSVQNTGENPFAGCLNPIRIRMIREDGALLERQGCRGSTGWSRTVSQSVSGFLTAKYGK